MSAHHRRPRGGGNPERSPHRSPFIPASAEMTLVVLGFLLSACHGGTLDAIYPGTLGHDPPPAVNLPPQDQGMEHR